MFDHVTIHVSDRDASEQFFETVLIPLGIESDLPDEQLRRRGTTSYLTHGDDGAPVTTGLHVAFAAPSREQVDAFWQAGIDAGCEGRRPARAADAVPRRLLRRVPAQPRWQQRRGGALRRGPPQRRRDRPPVDPRHATSPHRPPSTASSPRRSGSTCAGRTERTALAGATALVLAGRGRADAARPHGLPDGQRRRRPLPRRR